MFQLLGFAIALIMDVQSIGVAIALSNLFIGGGVFAVGLRLNYKWNVVLDRVDLMYKQYCDEHHIPFIGLKNDY